MLLENAGKNKQHFKINILFMNDDVKIQWYRTPLDKDTLTELRKLSDFQGFWRISLLLLMVILTGSLAYYAYLHWPLWAVIAVCFLHGSLFQFIGVSGPGHEMSHNTFFKTRFLNHFFGRLTGFLSWADLVAFHCSHNKHHQWTVHKDLDGEVILPARISRLDWIFFFTLNVKHFYSTVKDLIFRSIGIMKGDWMNKVIPPSDVKTRRQTFNWARILLLGHLSLAIVFLLTGRWFLIILITLAPFYGQWLNLLCGFTQHAGLQPSVPDFRRCCRTVMLNPFLQFLYCNMNYHLEHHMYAAVPCHNLPKLRKAIEYDLPPASPNLWTAWREILPAIQRQVKEPDYYLPVSLTLKP
jgi:fatty acid desaturase